MKPSKLNSMLHIKNLELHVNLGWRKKERSEEQPVLLDIDIGYPAPPLACETDDLDDGHCYSQLIEAIREQIAMKDFHLVEHLARDIYQIVKKSLPDQSHIVVRVTKYPKILGLTGGVCFMYGDEQ